MHMKYVNQIENQSICVIDWLRWKLSKYISIARKKHKNLVVNV